MTEYTLYLDESTSEDKNFICVGGFAIKNDDITLLRERMNKIRKIIWDEEYISQNNPVLHSTELNVIFKNRNNAYLSSYISNDEYRVFIGKTSEEIKNIYNSIYQELCLILKTMDVTVFCCVINKENYEYLYHEKHVDDYYHICLETIVENYIHFLDDKNSVGSIIYENRNSPCRNDSNSLDVKMYNNFCAMKLENKGMINLTQKSTLFRLRTFDYQRKSGGNLCLAFADFVIYNTSKMQHIEQNNRSEFMNKLYNNAYNGNNKIEDKDLRDYFGIRVLPIDIRLIQNLKSQNKLMKKKIKNQNNKIHKLEKKNKKLLEEKNDLVQQLNKNDESNANI
ncbi:MAG: hypothetical protein SOZ81_03050 [Agathobacter sp.]|nr:hypothetical protein [Agathobacter sp.]